MPFFDQNRKKSIHLSDLGGYHQLPMYVALETPITTTCSYLFDLIFGSTQTTKPLLGYGLTAGGIFYSQPQFKETFRNSRGIYRKLTYESKKHDL
jgi:hypothetical protein